MEMIDDFFISENAVNSISDDNYKNLSFVFKTLDSVARQTNKSIYVVDLYKKNFLYVSDNPLFLCGYKPDEIKNMGYNFYFHQVPKDETRMLLRFNKAGFVFFHDTPVDVRMKLSFSCDFHILENNRKKLINQKITPLLLDNNGNVWLATCIVSLSYHQEAGNLEAHIEGSEYYWTYGMESHKWEQRKVIVLDEREKDILQFFTQGYNEVQIADILYISKRTVKFHKQKLFTKLDVNTISAALLKSFQQKLI